MDISIQTAQYKSYDVAILRNMNHIPTYEPSTYEAKFRIVNPYVDIWFILRNMFAYVDIRHLNLTQYENGTKLVIT